MMAGSGDFAGTRAAAPFLRRAATAAGSCSKALAVRALATGAKVLARTPADDLVACLGLRESLWPAAGISGEAL